MGYGNMAADMQNLLAHAKWLLSMETFADLRNAIADDEIPLEDREDDEFGADSERQYREVMAMNPNEFMSWIINNTLAGAQMDRDFATMAYVTMTMARVQEFIDQ
jgi:hypothetical protein